MSDYPERLGVFPLPRLVMFPHAHIPLHVFEPRYQALLKDAIESNGGRFVLAVLRAEDEVPRSEVYPWACAGRVVRHLELGDGRSEIVWRGERVARLDDLSAEAPYRTARLTLVPEDQTFAEDPGAAERLAELRRLLELATPGALAALEARLEKPAESDGGMELLHTLATTFPATVDRKLKWLECTNSLSRWLSIRALLEAIAYERTRKARAITRYADLTPERPERN